MRPSPQRSVWGSENKDGPSAAGRQWVTLGRIFKAFLGFGFLTCKVGADSVSRQAIWSEWGAGVGWPDVTPALPWG